jgi:hypothetical protein
MVQHVRLILPHDRGDTSGQARKFGLFINYILDMGPPRYFNITKVDIQSYSLHPLVIVYPKT